MPVSAWSTTAADNDDADAASGINWAEGMLANGVNDSARAMMAQIKAWYDNVPSFTGAPTWDTSGNVTVAGALTVNGDVNVATTNITAATSVNITGLSTSGVYDIIVQGITPGTAGADVQLIASANNGSSYRSTGYDHARSVMTSAGASSTPGAASASSVTVINALSGGATTNYLSIRVYCKGGKATWSASYETNAGSFVSTFGSGDLGGADVNAIALRSSSGSWLASGTVKVIRLAS